MVDEDKKALRDLAIAALSKWEDLDLVEFQTIHHKEQSFNIALSRFPIHPGVMKAQHIDLCFHMSNQVVLCEDVTDGCHIIERVDRRYFSVNSDAGSEQRSIGGAIDAAFSARS